MVDEITWPGGRTRSEMGHLLERNGYLGGAAAIFDGEDPALALADYRGESPKYDDEEGRWLQAWIDGLRTTAEIARDRSGDALAKRGDHASLPEVLLAPRRLSLAA